MGRPKLSNEDKSEIRRLFNEGASIPALALKYDVAYVTIKRVVNPNFYAEHLERSSQYNKENAKQINKQASKTFRRFCFRLHRENDASIINTLDGKENMSQYIRELIVADMESDRSNSDGSQ